MEEDEMPRTNHNTNGGKMESTGLDDDDGDEELKRGRICGGRGSRGGGGGGGGGNIINQGGVDIISNNSSSGGQLTSTTSLCNWPSSRIFRVSRASGGKDRHSKVWTSKGLRDRRVRLSVPTAIQFYDLQDRLGYDQPSKAVEWLLNAASNSISELPSITTPFPDTPQQLTDGITRERTSSCNNDKRFDLAQIDVDNIHGNEEDDDEDMMLQQHQEFKTLSKSGCCSSTSETSKGSGLSFSRPESRIKARERARERAAGKEKEKEKEKEIGGGSCVQRRNQNLSQNASFTELLTSGGGGNNHSPNGNSNGNGHHPQREWGIHNNNHSTSSMDYFGTGLSMNSTNFLGGQIQLGNPIHQQFSVTGDQNQQYSFLPDHLVVRGGGGGGSNSDYNLNFSVVTCSTSSSGQLVGFNRGTLQSNSTSTPPSMLPHLNQRFNSNIDGNNSSNFFLSSPTTPLVVATTASASAAVVTPVENHYHHFLSGYDPQLQLCYDNNNTNRHHHDHKGKGKNSAS